MSSSIVAGRILHSNKHIGIALTYIHGIGRSTAKDICKKLKVSTDKKVQDLTDKELDDIRNLISDEYVVEGDKRREVAINIKQLQDMGCNRGIRHRRKLPVRGQNTKTNARTCKRMRRGGKR